MEAIDRLQFDGYDRWMYLNCNMEAEAGIPAEAEMVVAAWMSTASEFMMLGGVSFFGG